MIPKQKFGAEFGASIKNLTGTLVLKSVGSSTLAAGVIMIAALVLVATTGSDARAKDLGHRLGVGYADQFGLDAGLPSLAARYYPNADFGLMATLGVNTRRDDSKFGFGLKIMRLVFREDNLNFYVAGSAGVISDEDNGRTVSGFDVAGVVGVEFFWPGLDNLGVNFEAGVGVTSASNDVRVRTIGDHPLRAGIFFYF